MGIHSGPVDRVLDVNERANVAGTGIELAQRVMDCGDAGHILLSKRVADDLAPYARWHPHLHELGECEVKHGRKISLVNFYNGEIGNPETPKKLKVVEATVPATGRSPVSQQYLGVAGLIIAAIALGLLLFRLTATQRRPIHAACVIHIGKDPSRFCPSKT